MVTKEYPIGRDVEKMKERDIGRMTVAQLGKIMWNDDAFEKFTGWGKDRTFDKKKILHINDVERVLEKEYDEVPPVIGRDTFFNLLSRKYVGISRRRLEAFLKLQPENQKGQRRIKKSMAKSIVTKRPYERIQIDTIDSSKFGNFPFTLTVIDCFTKFFWAEPLTDHSSHVCSVAFSKILKRMLMSPGLIQSDNGSEFADLKGDNPSLKFIRSSPHLPQANGMIERVHGIIKRYVNALQAKEKRGYTGQLDKVVILYNNRKHTVTKHAPIDLNKTDLSAEIKEDVFKRIKRGAGKYNPNDGVFTKLAVGDYVRLAILRKSPLDKLYQRWSDDVYVVTSARSNDTYKLKEGNNVLKYIYQRDYLLKIPAESGKEIVREQGQRTETEKKKAETERLKNERVRQDKHEAKLVNTTNKEPSPFKFAKGDRLTFPTKFFELFDKESSDVPQKRTGVVTSLKPKQMEYYILFVDADYAKVNPKKNKPWSYGASGVEKFATKKEQN